MEDSSEELTYEADKQPFTFPQVKPLYSRLQIGRNVSRRNQLKPLGHYLAPQSDKVAHVEETPEDKSPSVNSLSGDQKPYCNIETNSNIRKDQKDVNVNGKLILHNNGRGNFNNMTPHPMMLKTGFSCKSTPLVKRLPKNCFTSRNKINEGKDMHYAVESELAQHPGEIVNENIANDNGQQDAQRNENIGKSSNKTGRILKDILNCDHNTHAKKSIDAVKSTKDSKCINAVNKYAFVPSITYRKESNIPEPRRSPKSGKMTPLLEINKKSSSCVSGSRRGNPFLSEKAKHPRSLFRDVKDEKLMDGEKYCPSLNIRQMDPSVLCVNGNVYTVLSKLGQGGSSQVYQVLDRKSSSLLAVKCVNLSDADEVTAIGYKEEIEVLSKLQNSNRVIILIDHEYLKHQQTMYVVMEKGETDLSTLLKRIAKSGDMSLPMIIFYWTEMLLAVKEIHSHGIVHADLKPANFLLVCGRLKLIDFGIASSIQKDATSVIKNSMHGTCNYMSPEAIQDPSDPSRTKVGYKSDVWSLGCILYNLLYWKTPFQHIENTIHKLKVIADPRHKIEFSPVAKCPPQLMNALKCCLTYEARKRPTVAELLATDYITYG